MSDHDSHHDGGFHPTVGFYTIVAVVLGIITGIELGPLFNLYPLGPGLLLFLSAAKFSAVVMLFMHLWFDEAIYKKLFIPSLLLAIVMISVVYVLFSDYRPEYRTAYTGPVRGFVAADVLAAEKAPAAPAHGEEGGTEGGSEGTAKVAAADGAKIFQTNCVACHGADATGGVGPNLTDGEWLHGGTLADIKNTVTNGVPGTAMISWTPVVGEAGVAAVADYVHGLGGGQ
ncbi:MAG: c-type cytochrome [Alphaproteobacteria bacterium]|nr:c-type cytochrome [Alphaproteobacteria bacterium]